MTRESWPVMHSPDPTTEFTPIAPNPYIVGNPVRNPSMFFGREVEFARVKKRFRETEHGSLMVFSGERRSGKTSILIQINEGRLGPEFISVLIDMQAMAVENEAAFFRMLSSEILGQVAKDDIHLAMPDFGEPGQASSEFREFLLRLLAAIPGRKLVLLFDEYELFEDKIARGILSPEVLQVFKHLIEHEPIYMVFTGSQHITERRQSYWAILNITIDHKRISYLDPSDAERLIREPVHGRLDYSRSAVDEILRMTAGQPFYTQAICQNLVDHANDVCSRHVRVEDVTSVVDYIVKNPFPQMTFLWDTLEQEQKLALALLAESISDPDTHRSAAELLETMKRSEYPLELDDGRVSTALEALDTQELLSRNDEVPAGFAFKMDLWRLWIRRMHSVWQVIREEGIQASVRSKKVSRTGLVSILALVGVAVVAGFLQFRPGSNDEGNRQESPAPPPRTTFVGITVVPEDAELWLDGDLVSRGTYSAQLATGSDHVLIARADGYVPDTLAIALADTVPVRREVVLQARIGSVQVIAQPGTARIEYRGRVVGQGEALLEALPLPEEHLVTISEAGYVSRTIAIRPQEGTVREVKVDLQRQVVNGVRVTTNPAGALVIVDGQAAGPAPTLVDDLTVGSHRFRLELDGHALLDTVLPIDVSTGDLSFDLTPELPGAIRIQGQPVARVFIDQEQLGSGAIPGKVVPMSSGSHTVAVKFGDQTYQIEVSVTSGDTVQIEWDPEGIRIIAQ